jgi:hypothetical protein
MRDPQLMNFFPTPPAFDSLRSDARFGQIEAVTGTGRH